MYSVLVFSLVLKKYPYCDITFILLQFPHKDSGSSYFMINKQIKINVKPNVGFRFRFTDKQSTEPSLRT